MWHPSNKAADARTMNLWTFRFCRKCGKFGVSVRFNLCMTILFGNLVVYRFNVCFKLGVKYVSHDKLTSLNVDLPSVVNFELSSRKSILKLQSDVTFRTTFTKCSRKIPQKLRLIRDTAVYSASTEFPRLFPQLEEKLSSGRWYPFGASGIPLMVPIIMRPLRVSGGLLVHRGQIVSLI